jgi:hypothetical protein
MINYLITKRYFTEIIHYFAYLYPFLVNDNQNEFNYLIKDYETRMLTLMEECLKKEQESVQYLREAF